MTTELFPPTGGMLLSLSTCAVIGQVVAHELRASGINYTPTVVDLDAPPSSPWLTSKEAAEHLRIGTSELQRLAAADVIPSEQDAPGGRRFFDRAELDHWRRSGGRRR